MIKDFFLNTYWKVNLHKEPSVPDLGTRIRIMIRFELCSLYHQERNAGYLDWVST
jgi:hypothetical protein